MCSHVSSSQKPHSRFACGFGGEIRARAHAHECVSISAAQSKGGKEEEGGGDVQQSFWQALVVARVYKIVEF